MKVTDSIINVGVDVPNQYKFEQQYSTPHGMAYNSYIVIGEKIALLDSVDDGEETTPAWFDQVEKALDGRKPDYYVVHHMEPDHSANLMRAMEKYPEMVLVASAKALAMVPQFFENADIKERTITVTDGSVIDLGDRQLRVYTAPFVHWPEVIVTYDTKEQVLFSSDAFGKFGANVYQDPWLDEARRYYCNIVGKYGAQVQMLLKKVLANPIKTIAPLHGPVLTGDLTPYIDAYQHWSTYTPEQEGVLVAYASVYGGTARAARHLADMLSERGEDVVLCDLCNVDVSEALAQAFRMNKVVFASITYDAGLFPAMFNFLHHLASKNWQNRKVALIENGTWAPVAGKLMSEALSKMKNIDIVAPTISIRSAHHTTDQDAFEKVATSLIEN